MSMTRDFIQAQQEMYSIQGSVFEVKAEALAQGMVEIPLGFQPLSVSVCDDWLAVSMYFEPGICLAKVIPDGNGGLKFDFELIQDVRHGTDTVRLFPGVSPEFGANRCFSATFNPQEGSEFLYLNRGDRMIYCICRSERYPGKWELYHKIELDETYRIRPAVHSIVPIKSGEFLVMEGTRITTDLRCNIYGAKGKLAFADCLPLPPVRDMVYIGFDHCLGTALYITSAMSTNIKVNGLAGVVRCIGPEDSRIIIPDVNGTGVARMKDGLGFIARYGRHYPGPFGGGQHGSLIIVPDHLWK